MAKHIESFKQFCTTQQVPATLDLQDALKIAETLSLELAITKTKIKEEINRPSASELELNWKKLRDDLCPDITNFGCARSGYILMERRSPIIFSPAAQELGPQWKISPENMESIKTRVADIDGEIARLEEELFISKKQL